jgi:hypothetical protein
LPDVVLWIVAASTPANRRDYALGSPQIRELVAIRQSCILTDV